MAQLAECLDCGNARSLLDECPYCGSLASPRLNSDTVELNIKEGGPTVDEALDLLTERIRTLHELGIKNIVLIHGYGSSGVGGRIRWAIRDALDNNRYADRVEEYFFGETVPYGSYDYHQLVRRRPGLERHSKSFRADNPGMTILLLGSLQRSA
jgi:hypothetical protein